jgi:hypothetical protein
VSIRRDRWRPVKWLAALGLAALSPPAMGQHGGYAPTFEALRAADVRLQRIGERLATANAALCRTTQPALGIALHTPDQYLGEAKAAAVAHFGFVTPVGVAGVVAGGPAARAGLRPDDAIAEIGGTDVGTLPAEKADTPETARLAAVDRFLAARRPTAAIDLVLRRGDARVPVRLTPLAACRARFEQRAADDVEASADGILVQISSRLLEELDDDGVAVLLAHELAHNVLEHRRRLDEAGVRRGLLSGFGRNVGLFRQTEVEADILAVHLLARAGYDPAIAPRFWREFGPRHASGLRLRTHPAWRDRVATMDAELPNVRAAISAGRAPDLIETRGKPLDGNWQALLVLAR